MCEAICQQQEQTYNTYDTNYQKVGEFHLVFGHPMKSEPQLTIFDDNYKLVEFRLSQIEEELNELKEAVEKEDFVECIDAVCDLMYFVYGTYHVFGVNFDDLTPKPKVRLFESPVNNTKVFENDISPFQMQISMLSQVLSLLTLSCEEHDFDSAITYLAKLEALCHTAGSLLGVNIDECFTEVHRSNMTKVCVSEEEAQETVQNYKTDTRYAEPDYRKSETTRYWVVYDKATSKILKSVKFELPKLADVIGLKIEVPEVVESCVNQCDPVAEQYHKVPTFAMTEVEVVVETEPEVQENDLPVIELN